MRRRAVWTLCILFAGCGEGGTAPDADADVDTDACPDDDTDGFASDACGGPDCDDGSAAVRPDAIELESWTTEIVAEGLTPGPEDVKPSIALGPDGTAHVAFREPAANGLRYASRADGAWTVEGIGSDGDEFGLNTAIAVDADDVVHLLYRTGSPVEARYAEGSRGAWSLTTVDAAARSSVSLALEADGTPHVAYRGDLGYVRAGERGIAGFESELIHTERQGGDPSLALAEDGTTYVAFTPLNGGLAVTSGVPSDWRTEDVDTTDGTGRDPSLALDPAGVAHVVYVSATTGALLHASHAAGGWEIETVQADGTVTGIPSLAIDAEGVLHVAYRVGTDAAEIRYATDAGGAWSVEPVVGGTPGSTAALVLAPDAIWIAFIDEGVGTVQVARRSLPNGVDDDCDGDTF